MDSSDFAKRRKKLLKHIGIGNVALLGSAAHRVRNRDVDYPFRQDSDFYYLTGFNEADALAVFVPGREEGEYVLFCREFDPAKALWEGAHAGLEGATRHFGADQAFAIDEADEKLPELLADKRKIFYPLGYDADLDASVMAWINQVRRQVRSGVTAPFELSDLGNIVHEMRLIKSVSELKLMRKAADISAQGHIKAMQSCQAGKYEYQIEAELVSHFTRAGLRAVAYPSIVAGGNNACTLHYTANADVLKKGDLLLIDAGAECDHYAADITRTFPVSGRFSDAQRMLYQLVLDAQLAAIATVKPGASWIAPHEAAVEVLVRGLVKLGLLKGRVKKIIKNEKYKPFYMHKTGHWLGMDVHDVGAYKLNGEWRTLQPGMVLTVEPGLYIAADCQDVDAQWRGIGIRIEDDVLVTADGHDVLTHRAPKAIADIEALMQVP